MVSPELSPSQSETGDATNLSSVDRGFLRCVRNEQGGKSMRVRDFLGERGREFEKRKLRQSTEPRKKIVLDKMECHAMKRRMWLVGALAALLWATPAKQTPGSSFGRRGASQRCKSSAAFPYRHAPLLNA